MNKILLLLVIFPLTLVAQPGKITVVQDSGIQKVLRLYRIFATEKRAVNGFRIQLGANSNRQILLDIKAQFLHKYPDVGAYISYQQPQFKLRVGDFNSRAEANEFMDDLRSDFPTLFLVADQVLVRSAEW
ncbi:MAG: SPOR domain-containing protein [Chitinophagales bacterium]|jgi:hypothetical protein|nr:SPOR domain-containing protein [Chitinophagales bacterium]